MKKSILFLLTLLHLVGCSSNDAVTNSNGGATGDLVGSVLLVDTHNATLADQSGVLIQIDGTSFSALSDSNGHWVIHNLPSKTYAITFSKAGFYTRHDKSFTFVAGVPVRYREVKRNLDYVILGPLPNFTVSLDGIIMPTKKIDAAGNPVYDFGFVFAHTSSNTPGGVYVGMYLVASRNPNLKIEDRTTIGLMEPYYLQNPSLKDSSADLSGTLTYSVYASFAKPGDTVYFKAYPIFTPVYEYDATTGYDNVVGYSPNGSNVLSGVMQ